MQYRVKGSATIVASYDITVIADSEDEAAAIAYDSVRDGEVLPDDYSAPGDLEVDEIVALR